MTAWNIFDVSLTHSLIHPLHSRSLTRSFVHLTYEVPIDVAKTRDERGRKRKRKSESQTHFSASNRLTEARERGGGAHFLFKRSARAHTRAQEQTVMVSKKYCLPL